METFQMILKQQKADHLLKAFKEACQSAVEKKKVRNQEFGMSFFSTLLSIS